GRPRDGGRGGARPRGGARAALRGDAAGASAAAAGALDRGPRLRLIWTTRRAGSRRAHETTSGRDGPDPGRSRRGGAGVGDPRLRATLQGGVPFLPRG